jgi:hypothetical protein
MRTSSGAIGMLVALSLCTLTHAYDMTPSDATKDAPYHYYNDTTKGHGPVHGNWDAEHDLWLKLTTTPTEVARRTGITEYVGFPNVVCQEKVQPQKIDLSLEPQPISLISVQMKSRWILANVPPRIVICGLVVFLSLASGYMLWLWWQQGLLLHMSKSLNAKSISPGAAALLIYLFLLVSLDLLIKHEAEQGGGRYQTSPFVMVPLVEFGKLLVSSVLFFGGRCVSHVQGCSGHATIMLSADDDSYKTW